MHPKNSLLSLLILPLVLISALPSPSPTTTPATLLPRASLTPAESSLLANNYAAWTTSIAQASASAAHAAALAAYTPPVLSRNDLASPSNATCQVDRSKPDLHPDACAELYTDICTKLLASAAGTYTADQWVWRSAKNGGCSLGYWYPSGARGVAPVPPDVATCASNVNSIWLQMSQLCIAKPSIGPWRSGVTWNAASVNIGTLPGEGHTGTAMDPRMVSYLLASSPLD